MNPTDTVQGRVALEFAQALVSGDFENAHRMLAPALREALMPSDLERSYRHMLRDASGPPTLVEVHNVMDEWPGRRPDEVGWAYVGICGEDYAEAVAVVVSAVERALCVGAIEWGRP